MLLLSISLENWLALNIFSLLDLKPREKSEQVIICSIIVGMNEDS